MERILHDPSQLRGTQAPSYSGSLLPWLNHIQFSRYKKITKHCTSVTLEISKHSKYGPKTMFKPDGGQLYLIREIIVSIPK